MPSLFETLLQKARGQNPPTLPATPPPWVSVSDTPMPSAVPGATSMTGSIGMGGGATGAVMGGNPGIEAALRAMGINPPGSGAGMTGAAGGMPPVSKIGAPSGMPAMGIPGMPPPGSPTVGQGSLPPPTEGDMIPNAPQQPSQPSQPSKSPDQSNSNPPSNSNSAPTLNARISRPTTPWQR